MKTNRNNSFSKVTARNRALMQSTRPIFECLDARQMMSGSEGEPDPLFPDHLEPNNSFAAATNFGTTFNRFEGTLSIHLTTDQDYFKFTAPINGTAIAQIAFNHLDGNLKLTGFNSAQQQIAFSDTSTFQNGLETISINAQAGQTYFIKVHGGTSHDYSLDLHALTANFDWSMPKRTGAQNDQFGLPMFPNSRDYARPNPIMIGGVETPRYAVQLSSLTGVPNDGVNYQWNITSPLYSTTTSGVNAQVDLPQGQYIVTCTATAGGNVVTSTQTVKVKDHLIVGIGDSYGSGEGNPHAPIVYDGFGFATRGAIWATSPDGQEATFHRMAHRSAYAAVAQAALQLENADPKSSVTFVFLDHTGATIDIGLLGAQPSGDPGAPGTTAPQVERLQQIVGNRTIDNLVMSIGGNDMGFATVLSRLVQAIPALPGYQEELNDIMSDALANIQTLGDVGYPALASALSQFNIEQTFLMEYPDITRSAAGTGNFGDALGDVVPGLSADPTELALAFNMLFGPLASTMRDACKNNGWTFVSGIADAFRFHGYGDWLRTASDSSFMQGPRAHIITTPIEVSQTIGTMHPIAGGVNAQKVALLDALTKPNLRAKSFTLSPDAFKSSVNSKFTMTVKNTSSFASAATHQVKIYISQDNVVNTSDIGLNDFVIPALGPGESYTFTGDLPHISDPFLNPANVMFAGLVVDIANAVAENNEVDNVLFRASDVPGVQPERDLTQGAQPLSIAGIPVGMTSSTDAWLGMDEVIGDRDMDIYRFTAGAGQSLGFDIDSNNNLNTFIRLYKVVNNALVNPLSPLAANDNDEAPGETGANPFESYLSYTFGQAGEYALVVSHEYNQFSDPMRVDGRSHAFEGSYTLNINPVDLIAPSVIASSFEVDANRLSFRFSENVAASIATATLVLDNLTTGQSIFATAIYDSATDTARFSFPSFASGLPAGNYRARIPAANIYDQTGNNMSADAAFSFFALPGDANRDRRVDIADFSIVASRFNRPGVFTQGDFNYSGATDISDFAILASKFNNSLPSAQRGSASSTRMRSFNFDTSRILPHLFSEDTIIWGDVTERTCPTGL